MWDDIERKKARSPDRREEGSFNMEDFRPLINNFGDSSIDMAEVDKLMNPLAGPEVSTA